MNDNKINDNENNISSEDNRLSQNIDDSQESTNKEASEQDNEEVMANVSNTELSQEQSETMPIRIEGINYAETSDKKTEKKQGGIREKGYYPT